MELYIFCYRINIEKKDKKDKEANAIKRAFEARMIDKIPAIKKVRELFQDTSDQRRWLREAKDFIEGNYRPNKES